MRMRAPMRNARSLSRELVVLIGNCDDLLDDLLARIVTTKAKQSVNENCRLLKSWKDEEILSVAAEQDIDIFILVLNNLLFVNKPTTGRLNEAMSLVRYLKKMYDTQIIGMISSSYLKADSDLFVPHFSEKARLAGVDYLLSTPVDTENFERVIDNCLELLREGRR